MGKPDDDKYWLNYCVSSRKKYKKEWDSIARYIKDSNSDDGDDDSKKDLENILFFDKAISEKLIELGGENIYHDAKNRYRTSLSNHYDYNSEESFDAFNAWIDSQKPKSVIIAPGRDSDKQTVVAIFGPDAQLIDVKDASGDSRNPAQRIVVAREGEILESFVKRFDWHNNPEAEKFFRREAHLLPLLESLGCSTPEVHGSIELDEEGRIAMKCYDAETFEEKLATLSEEHKIDYLKRIVSSLVQMQHLVESHSSRFLTSAAPMDQFDDRFFTEQMLIASRRISGSEEIGKQFIESGKRLIKAPRHPMHYDFTPRNILVTKADDLVITDAECMSVLGGPITMDYSQLMIWPTINLDPMSRIEIDRHFVSEWNKYGNPITMDEFYTMKRDTDLMAARRFAGAYAMLMGKKPCQQFHDRLVYFLQMCEEISDTKAA
jgi:hypothetical protein